MCQKKLYPRKQFCQKKFQNKTNLGLKFFTLNEFGSEKMLGPNIFRSEKDFVQRLLVKKSWHQMKFPIKLFITG